MPIKMLVMENELEKITTPYQNTTTNKKGT